MAATMEAELMSSAVALDASPSSLLRAMRGWVVAARIAYPDVLHVEIRNDSGELWRLASQDADFSPPDPSGLIGRSVEDVEIDETTGGLRCRLSDGSSLELRPATSQAHDGPPSWELIAPSGLVLEFGPGLRWQIAGMDDPSDSAN